MDNNGPIPYELLAFASFTSAGALARGTGGLWTRTGAGAWSLVLAEGVAQANCCMLAQIQGFIPTTSWTTTDGDGTHKFVNFFVGGVGADVFSCVGVWRVL